MRSHSEPDEDRADLGKDVTLSHSVSRFLKSFLTFLLKSLATQKNFGVLVNERPLIHLIPLKGDDQDICVQRSTVVLRKDDDDVTAAKMATT